MKKITRQDLEKYVTNAVTKHFSTIQEDKDIITKKDLEEMIVEAINKKLEGQAYDVIIELQDGLKSALVKLTKSIAPNWIKDVNRLRQKNDGYVVEVIGSGNVKVIIKWQKSAQKNNLFELISSEPCIAGDEYKENVYKFMTALLMKKDKISEMLIEITRSLGSIGSEISEDEEEPETKPISEPETPKPPMSKPEAPVTGAPKPPTPNKPPMPPKPETPVTNAPKPPMPPK